MLHLFYLTMKRLLKIGFTNSIQSLTPILTWYAIGIVFGNSMFYEGFSLTYCYQFIWLIVYSLIICGQAKYNKKNNNILTGYPVLMAFIIFGLVYLYTIFNISNICSFLNVDMEYKYIIKYGVGGLVCDIVSCGVSVTLQYEDREDKAFVITNVYYICRLLIVVLVGLLVNDFSIGVNIILSINLFMCIVLMVKFLNWKHLELNCFKGVMITAPSNVSSVFMFIIYLFGISSMVAQSAVFFTSYNMAALCTDTQWDVLSSGIDTDTTLRVCDGDYDRSIKRILINSIAYSIILLSTSYIMICISRMFIDFNIAISLVIISIECVTFPMYAIGYVFKAWLYINCKSKLIFIFPIIQYIARTIVSLNLNSQYNLSIAVAISSILNFTWVIYLYRSERVRALNLSNSEMVEINNTYNNEG